MGMWEPGFNHSISPSVAPYGTDPTVPFQNFGTSPPGNAGYLPPPPPPTIGDVAGSGTYTANYYWGQNGIFGPPEHRQAFCAIHMTLIPKGPNRGKVMVWGGNMPVLLRPNGALSSQDWFCQPWSIIDPSSTPNGQPPSSSNPRMQNFLLPLSARGATFVPAGETAQHEWVPTLFCSGHAWSQHGDLVVAGGERVARRADGTVPAAAPLTAAGATATFLFQFYPDLGSQPFIGALSPLYAGSFGYWRPHPQGLMIDRYYPSVTLSQRLALFNPPSEAIVVSGGQSGALALALVAENSYEIYRVEDFFHSAFLVPHPNGATGYFEGPNGGSAVPDEKFELYPRQYVVGNIASGASTVFPMFLAGPEKLGSRTDLNVLPQTPTWDTGMGVGRNPQPLPWDHERHDGATLLMCFPGASGCNVVRLGGGYNLLPQQPVAVATDTAEFCNATAPSGQATWSPLPSASGLDRMPGGPRQFPNAVTLPDGSILVIGGADPALAILSPPDPDLYVDETVLYRPGIGWVEVEGGASPTRRGYHSTAVLLPDGRVFVGGGELRLGPQRAGVDHDYDIYVPHYLIGSPKRPVITNVTAIVGTPLATDGRTPPAHVLHNDELFRVVCSNIDAFSPFDRVVLIAPGSITHHADMSTRYVLLQSQQGANSSERYCGIPDNGTVPRGFYMMFALNSAGIPSVATWIQVQ